MLEKKNESGLFNFSVTDWLIIDSSKKPQPYEITWFTAMAYYCDS